MCPVVIHFITIYAIAQQYCWCRLLEYKKNKHAVVNKCVLEEVTNWYNNYLPSTVSVSNGTNGQV